MPMARALARQAGGASAGSDDLEAEAYAALVEAAQSFDPDRGVDFAFHARSRILGALRDYRRFLFHMGRKGQVHESPVFERLGPSHDRHGIVLGKEPEAAPSAGLESLEAVESIIRLLPRSEATACRLLYVEGKSYAETAATIGCSKGHLSRLHTEAMARLRRVYGEALAG
jgi:RNA polymerase sigma factor (sigma-70 family)